MIIKLGECRICKAEFEKRSSLHVLCSGACAITDMNAKKAKREAKELSVRKKETKEKLIAIKTITEWLREVQRHCNRYVRLRDANEPCISCGTVNPNIKYDAGHYRTSKAAPQLRFNTDNIHKQCSNNCNVHLSGNIFNYRPRLIKKIGLARVEALENNNELHRYTIEEAKALLNHFRNLCKEVEQKLAA